MEANKRLIIELLVHDMRYHQLITGIEKMGFNNELNGSDMVAIIGELMGLPDREMSWEWFEGYMEFLHLAPHYEITGDGKNLLPLAESCYTFLSLYAQPWAAIKRPK